MLIWKPENEHARRYNEPTSIDISAIMPGIVHNTFLTVVVISNISIYIDVLACVCLF